MHQRDIERVKFTLRGNSVAISNVDVSKKNNTLPHVNGLHVTSPRATSRVITNTNTLVLRNTTNRYASRTRAVAGWMRGDVFCTASKWDGGTKGTEISIRTTRTLRELGYGRIDIVQDGRVLARVNL